jgi:hypothetical protein
MLSEIISNLITGDKKKKKKRIKIKEEMMKENLHKNPIKTFTAHALQCYF